MCIAKTDERHRERLSVLVYMDFVCPRIRMGSPTEKKKQKKPDGFQERMMPSISSDFLLPCMAVGS